MRIAQACASQVGFGASETYASQDQAGSPKGTDSAVYHGASAISVAEEACCLGLGLRRARMAATRSAEYRSNAW